MTETEDIRRTKVKQAKNHERAERALRDHRNLMAALTAAERSLREARRIAKELHA